MGSLTKRLLVSAIAIPLLIGVTFWDITLPFKVMAVLGLGLALLEYLKLADARKMKTLKIEGLLALAALFLPRLWGPKVLGGGHAVFLFGLLVLTLSFLWSKRPLKEMVVSVSVTFFGVVYFGVLGDYFFRLRDLSQGAWHLLLLYIATWAYDTGGYFAGHWWGRHHFAPLASPKKSVEGCIGGFVLVFGSLLVLWKIFPFYPENYSLMDLLVLSLLLSFFGQLGDLVESVIKRSLNAKDSGSLLPGHGGVFDRIDSLLFNAPVLFYYLWLAKH
jgi:phosphatidate cytidylyltransferase